MLIEDGGRAAFGPLALPNGAASQATAHGEATAFTLEARAWPAKVSALVSVLALGVGELGQQGLALFSYFVANQEGHLSSFSPGIDSPPGIENPSLERERE